MRKENYVVENNEVVIIDMSIIDNFINLYGIYLEKKNAYDFCVKRVNEHFSVKSPNNVVQEIYMRILQMSMEKIDNFLLENAEDREVTREEINVLKRLSSNIKKYQKLLSMFKISDSDTFSKFIEYKSIMEIEKEVRDKYKNCSEVFVMNVVNEMFSCQEEILRKNINDIYNELISVKKYLEIISEYESKIKNRSFLFHVFIKYSMNRRLKEELKKEKNENFMRIASMSGDVSSLVINEIKKYSKYILPISSFTEKIYEDVMQALNSFDEENDEIQVTENVSIIKSNQEEKLNIQNLKNLYEMFGVDKFYLDDSSLLWNLNYKEALAKLNFCEEYYMLKHNCSASGTNFQVEVLFMNSIEFQRKFDIDMIELIDKYCNLEEIVNTEENLGFCYQKVM